mgnify:CR=1 FL=1
MLGFCNKPYFHECSVKFDKNIKVFGTDISSNILGKYFVDKFFIIKPIKEIDILEFLGFCKKNKIAYIIPTRDEDVLFFAKNICYVWFPIINYIWKRTKEHDYEKE